MSEWHYPPEVPTEQAQYLVEKEIKHWFTKYKKTKAFFVEYYFIVKPEDEENCDYYTGWHLEDGKNILRWMEIPE